MLKNNKILTQNIDDIARASDPGRHGEIRTLSLILDYLDNAGYKITDDVLMDILAYNRSILKKDGVPPRCVHCWHLTDMVKFINE